MPDVIDRFIELWNEGSVEELRPLLADGYTYGDPLYPGPYDADAHVVLMRQVVDRAPDRRVIDVVRVPGGAEAVAVTGEWVGTIGGSELRLRCIFAFDINEDATLIKRMRCFHPLG
jgi:hypothetical protein